MNDSQLELIATRLTAHHGDPCRWCNTPHDDVSNGPCPGRPSFAMLLDGLKELDKAATGKAFELLRLEAKALLDAITPNGLSKLCPHGLPPGCCAVCIAERKEAQDEMRV